MKITDDVYALDSTKGNYSYLISGDEIFWWILDVRVRVKVF
jgi:hypothetical protein